MTCSFLPEGRLLATPENQTACATQAGLLRALEQRQILEGRVMLCDAEHNLIVSLGTFTGMIPRAEAALGIADGSTREIAILSRVGKVVCFTVESLERAGDTVRPILSRRNAEALALEHLMATLTPGMVIPATVTHLEPFGAFVDLGCGVPSMVGIEHISVSRISHPGQRFSVGQEIYAVVTQVLGAQGRVLLSHKELLGTWGENASALTAGMTVPGIVRGVKDYGTFIELAPNLSGLAELRGDLQEGDHVSVYIKAILPDRMKIKLVAIDKLPAPSLPAPLHYYITGGRLTKWQYAPAGAERPVAETVFAL